MTLFLSLVAMGLLGGPQEPGVVSAVLACRFVSDSSERLACFDRNAAALEQAQSTGQIAVVDRAAVERTRRESFGFDMPSFSSVFGAAGGQELTEVQTTLESARKVGGAAQWVFRLADGTVWRQIDSASTYFPNRVGQPVRVRRAALGSYLLTIGTGGAFRVRRD